jgi:predicted nucleotidyltransferase component of viral defense system
MTKAPKDIAASVRARLLQLAKTRGEDFQLLLTRYANERLLYRLSKSRHASGFVLKGAALFMLWTEKPHRATRDVDLLGFGDPSPDRIRGVLHDVVETKVDDDGLVFDASSLEIGAIREEQEYGGIRAVLIARLAAAKIRLQIDVGFGDVITPQAIDVDYPALLEFPAPHLRAYPRETVVAEKLEAIVHLGLANSRMKDFYDLMVLSRSFTFEGDVLVRAIRATFERRCALG